MSKTVNLDTFGNYLRVKLRNNNATQFYVVAQNKAIKTKWLLCVDSETFVFIGRLEVGAKSRKTSELVTNGIWPRNEMKIQLIR